jgi:hypothetical protein
MHSGKIFEKTAFRLTFRSGAEQTALRRILDLFGFQTSKAAEVVENLTDLAVASDLPLLEILDRPELRRLIHEACPHTGERFRDTVRSMRNPSLAIRKSEFDSAVERLPKNVRITPSRSFETDECVVEVKLESLNAANELVAKLRPHVPH